VCVRARADPNRAEPNRMYRWCFFNLEYHANTRFHELLNDFTLDRMCVSDFAWCVCGRRTAYLCGAYTWLIEKKKEKKRRANSLHKLSSLLF
jgi:hypothetical protein